MTRILELSISNFRGISSFFSKFDRNVICLVGRGDSCKTTVLDAIKYVLSSSWNPTFYDTDFYNLNTDNPIEIIISIGNVPGKLISEGKYGLYLRTLCSESGNIKDDIKEGDTTVLTIKLIVNKDLVPKWCVINERNQENKAISHIDRSLFNCFMVSDSVDSHFSWNKGNPLHTLLRLHEIDPDQEKVVLESIREAKEKIDNTEFTHFSDVTDLVRRHAASLGLNLENIQTTLDMKEMNVKEGKVSLHDGGIPFRLKGKGSKRLASIAIQTAISSSGGMALIDEIEQGLEPDRARHIARSLKDDNSGQVIITTHSRDVITELEAKDLLVLHRNKNNGKILSEYLDLEDNQLQGVIRACPEAFFAKNVIVCEGATEVGICRALDKFRIFEGKNSLSFNGCAYVDGTGNSFTERALSIKRSGILVSVLCDSDVDGSLNPSKEDLENEAISIFDCVDGYSIEKQVFADLPWAAIHELLDYVIKAHSKTEDSIKSSLKSKYAPGTDFPEDWKNSDTSEMRSALEKTSVVKGKEWFKRIDHGEKLGEIIFKYFDDIEGKPLKIMLTGLLDWIEN